MMLTKTFQRTINRQIVKSASAAFASENPQVTMVTEESKHRHRLPLYDLEPKIENCWVAPNATVGKSS